MKLYYHIFRHFTSFFAIFAKKNPSYRNVNILVSKIQQDSLFCGFLHDYKRFLARYRIIWRLWFLQFYKISVRRLTLPRFENDSGTLQNPLYRICIETNF